MRVVIFEEKKSIEATVRLKMRRSGDDVVQIVAVDESGATISGGLLLSIDPKGVELMPNVSEHLLFDRDSKGKILVR